MRCMGRTYSVKRRTIPNYGRATLFNAHQSCRFEPGTSINTRRGAHDWRILVSIIKRCRIKPGTCIMARSVTRMKIFIFIYSQNQLIMLSIETHAISSPNEHSLEPRGSRTNVQPVLPIRNNH
jgi:hypothetical protein